MNRDYSLTGSDTLLALQKGLAEAEWYRSPVPRDKMRELLIRRNGPAVRDTIIWFGLIFGSGYLVFLFWGSWLAIFPYIIYSVLYASTSDSRWHESGHGTAFKTDWMNNLLYEISSFMVFRQSTVWRWSHTRHHSDTIIRGRDPEIAVPRPPDIRKIILSFFGISGAVPEFKRLVRHAAGKIDSQAATYVPEQEYGKVFLRARIYVSIYLAVIAVSVISGTILPLMFIGLPTLLGTWLMPVYGITQHAGLQENVLDHRLNCRTVYMNRIHRYLYWNMNYHVEHHMFPLVPYHALPRLHELVRADCPEPYKGLADAWKEIIPALLRQRKDPSYFVERKIPVSSAQAVRHLNRITVAPGKIVNGRIEICPVSVLPVGEVIRFDYAYSAYALCRTVKDEFYAIDGICTHGNGDLGDGVLIGDMIECPKHNGRFSLIDGSPKRDPVSVGINTYKTEVIDGKIWMSLIANARDQSLREYDFRVVSNKNLTAFIKELTLEPLTGEALKFVPGQYVRFEIPPGRRTFDQFHIDLPFESQWESMKLSDCFAENMVSLKRNYSMATNTETGGQLAFNVRIALPADGSKLPSGAGSSYLFSLKPGDEVKLEGPFGNFLIKDSEREMVYIGGGAGMAPLRCHISWLFDTLKTRRKVSYWYGARSSADLFYLDYFENLEKDYANFSFHVALSEPGSKESWDGHTGFISDVAYQHYLINHIRPAEVEYYLCGPPAMIKASLVMLRSIGVADDQILYDEF
jgi:Na+-transporting NADH:ubiquinone oxidoreductase subunit F